MTDNTIVNELKDVTIRFSGDSGDGMQLSGTLFSTLSAILKRNCHIPRLPCRNTCAKALAGFGFSGAYRFAYIMPATKPMCSSP